MGIGLDRAFRCRIPLVDSNSASIILAVLFVPLICSRMPAYQFLSFREGILSDQLIM